VTPQSGNQVSTSLGNSGLCWTVFARNRNTAVSAEGNGDLQTLKCVLVARPRRCLTLSNPVPWQKWMAAYLGYTLRMRTLFHGWPIMVNDTHTRRRRRRRLPHSFTPGSKPTFSTNPSHLNTSFTPGLPSRSFDWTGLIMLLDLFLVWFFFNFFWFFCLSRVVD